LVLRDKTCGDGDKAYGDDLPGAGHGWRQDCLPASLSTSKPIFFSQRVKHTGSAFERHLLREALYKWTNTITGWQWVLN